MTSHRVRALTILAQTHFVGIQSRVKYLPFANVHTSFSKTGGFFCRIHWSTRIQDEIWRPENRSNVGQKFEEAHVHLSGSLDTLGPECGCRWKKNARGEILGKTGHRYQVRKQPVSIPEICNALTHWLLCIHMETEAGYLLCRLLSNRKYVLPTCIYLCPMLNLQLGASGEVSFLASIPAPPAKQKL